jgi:hypothetical protein
MAVTVDNLMMSRPSIHIITEAKWNKLNMNEI